MLSERDVIKCQTILTWRKGRQYNKRPFQLHPDVRKCFRIKQGAYKGGKHRHVSEDESKRTTHPVERLRQQRSLLLSSDTELVIKVIVNASETREGQKESAAY